MTDDKLLTVQCGYRYPHTRDQCPLKATVETNNTTILHIESEDGEGYSITTHLVTDRKTGVTSTTTDEFDIRQGIAPDVRGA